MELSHMREFLQLVKCGSFAEAATELGARHGLRRWFAHFEQADMAKAFLDIMVPGHPRRQKTSF